MSQKCDATCRDGSPCEAWAVTGEDKCRMHLGKSVDGESHAGNFNNLQTGNRTAADRWHEFLEENAPERFRELYHSYFEELVDQGATESQALRIARLWTRADYNDMKLIEEDFETERYYEGEFVGMEFDSDRDGAVARSERAARLIRREEELSPYSQQSSGTEVLIKGDSFDANISHERVSSDAESEETDE